MKLYLKIIILLFIIGLISCKKSNSNYDKNKDVESLNRQAIFMLQQGDSASLVKAVKLLDSAILIKRDYFHSYYNKLIILNVLKKEKDIYKTLKEIEKFYPKSPFYKTQIGMCLERMGDMKQAKIKYLEAERLYQNINDTLNVNNKDYSFYSNFEINQAINLRLLGNESISNKYFDRIISTEKDSVLKNIITKYKHLKRESFFNGDYERIVDSISSIIPPEILLGKSIHN